MGEKAIHKAVKKGQLEKVLTYWGKRKLSSRKLQNWMIRNYNPALIEVGPGEPEMVQQAMNLIMNEYELARPESFVIEKYSLALDLLDCNEDEFADAAARFLRHAFTS